VALRVAAGYALLATLATALALALRDGMPWVHPSPWVPMREPLGLAVSALLGVVFASAIILSTRIAVARFHWARRLHIDLRPVARDLSAGHILLLAGLSSLGEELLFRGLLTPVTGVLISAALFGLAHQMKGPSRWVWAAWATGVGLGLGAIFALTGSLVGPLLAHAVVNAANLLYLRDHDPEGGESERHPA
jgi:membrane protease YdiL (CAAX protease family)